MSTALGIADAFRHVLVPFLVASAAILALLLIFLCVQRGLRNLRASRRARIDLRHRADIDAAIVRGDLAARARLLKAPLGQRAIIGDRLVAELSLLTGPAISSGRDLARALELIRVWTADLGDSRWWKRAGAAIALGVVEEPAAYNQLVALLEDPHEEARAAAVQAIGRLGDPRAVTPLLQRMHEQSRHQRVRIVAALSSMRAGAGGAILAFARSHPDVLPEIADVLALTCGSAAVDDLLGWSASADASTRAAAVRALGTIGIDDRGYYFMLRALGDSDPEVRAMAARALGRSGRGDAAPYLAPCLDDDWTVAANGAQALKRLSEPGHAELTRIAQGAGPAADLARQVLWEGGQASAS
jgi:HEAT repeat protein